MVEESLSKVMTYQAVEASERKDQKPSTRRQDGRLPIGQRQLRSRTGHTRSAKDSCRDLAAKEEAAHTAGNGSKKARQMMVCEQSRRTCETGAHLGRTAFDSCCYSAPGRTRSCARRVESRRETPAGCAGATPARLD